MTPIFSDTAPRSDRRWPTPATCSATTGLRKTSASSAVAGTPSTLAATASRGISKSAPMCTPSWRSTSSPRCPSSKGSASRTAGPGSSAPVRGSAPSGAQPWTAASRTRWATWAWASPPRASAPRWLSTSWGARRPSSRSSRWCARGRCRSRPSRCACRSSRSRAGPPSTPNSTVGGATCGCARSTAWLGLRVPAEELLVRLDEDHGVSGRCRPRLGLNGGAGNHRAFVQSFNDALPRGGERVQLLRERPAGVQSGSARPARSAGQGGEGSGMRREEWARIRRREMLAAYYEVLLVDCLLYTSPSPRDRTRSRMPSSA